MKESIVKSPWVVVRGKGLPLSFHLDARVPLVILALVIVLLGAMIVYIGVGEYYIPPLEVIKTVFHLPSSNSEFDFVVNTLRVPRVLAGLLAGIMLALSGGIMQSLTRNPLASPELTGVTAGASLVAVVLIIGFPLISLNLLPPAAFAGGMIVATLIYILAWRGHDSPLRLILIGIGLMSITGAISEIMITFGEVWHVQMAMMWLSGSLHSRTQEDVLAVLPWFIVIVPLALMSARELNALTLGDEVAGGLGSPVTRNRLLLLAISAALAGVTVTVAGTLGFVGLIAPHLGRRLVGPSHQGLLPVTALLGGLIVVLSDLVGRTVIAPAEIPVGIVVSIIGAPFFLWLLYQSRNR